MDGLIWLHDMARKHCVELLLEDNTQPIVDEFRDRAVRYAILGISLVIVLDGRRLGGKGPVDTSRARERLEAQSRLDDYLLQCAAAGAPGRARSTRLDDALITAVVGAMRQLGITVLKAPYETDAMLAALDHLDLIQYVLSEDGDLIV